MKTSIKQLHWKRVSVFALLVTTLGLAGCDLEELLTVEDRDVVTPGTLDDPNVLPVVVAGAIGDFTNAFSGGGGDSYVSVTGLFSDEFFSSGTFPTRTATDRREQQAPASGNTSDDAYNDLQEARRALKDAAARVENLNGTDDPDYAELKALEGYTITMLGEAFCSAVPLSNVNDAGEFVFGEPMTSSELFTEAVARFDAALGAGDGAWDDLAAIGKGRALLAQGDAAAAAAAVADVDTDFVYAIQHSTSSQTNDVYSKQNNGRFSQSDMEGSGGNTVAFRSAGDPRTPWEEDPLGGFDEQYPLYMSLLYTDFADPLPLATGTEARLIEAEAELEAGDYAGMTAILNALRAGSDLTLAPLAVPATEAAAIDQLFEERAFWLFLTGHRMADMRRLVYEYGLTEDEAYPTGTYHKGGTYGDDVVFPIDFDEGNNTSYDPAACVVTSASIN